MAKKPERRHVHKKGGTARKLKRCDVCGGRSVHHKTCPMFAAQQLQQWMEEK